MPGAETAPAIKGARPRPAGSEDAGAEHKASVVTGGGSRVQSVVILDFTRTHLHRIVRILYKKYKLNFDDIQFFTLLRL